MGANAEAKANAATAIPELIEIAANPSFEENRKEKHAKNAKNGWYKYDIRFVLPIYENEVLIRYNIFNAKFAYKSCGEWEKVLIRYFGSKKRN